MKNYGRTSVHEFLGDFVVYRNLLPVDQRLPGLSEIRSEVATKGAVPGAEPRPRDGLSAAAGACVGRA